MRAYTHNAQQGAHVTRGAGVGRTKQWGTETGDLWKGEGWGGEHGQNSGEQRQLVCGRERDGAGNMANTRWTLQGLS